MSESLGITVSPLEDVPYEMRCDVCGKHIWLDWPWPFSKGPVGIYFSTTDNKDGTFGMFQVKKTRVIYTHDGRCEKMGIFKVMDEISG